MTSQAPGSSELAAPYWPSPYLAEGQSVPDAYPAPAKPGQPRYGEAAGPFLTASQGRFSRPGYGQPRPASAQASVATAAVATGADAVPAAAADFPLASAWERLLAMTLDWLLILGASFGLLHEQMFQLIHRAQSMLLAAQTLAPAAQQTAMSNFARDGANQSALFSYFLMVFLMALVYFWALSTYGGATLGKRLLGLRVVRAADRSPAGVWVSGIRTVAFLIGPAILTFSPGTALIGVLGAAIWFADSLVLVRDPQKRALHDKVAGTVVVRKAPHRGTG